MMTKKRSAEKTVRDIRRATLIAIDDYGFVLLPGEYEHPASPCSVIR